MSETSDLKKIAREMGMRETAELNKFHVEIMSVIKKCCSYKNPSTDLANITLVLGVVVANVTDLFHINRDDIPDYLTDFKKLVLEVISDYNDLKNKEKNKMN